MRRETIKTNNTDYNKKEQTIEKLKNIGENIFGILMLIASVFMFQLLLTTPVESTEAKLQRQTINATVQDKFSEIDASGIIAFTDTEYYITVSMKNNTNSHDIEVTKEQYHNIGKGSHVKCTVTYDENKKLDSIELAN